MSNIVSVSWERGPDASRLYCKTGNVTVRSSPHLPFVMGDGFQQCGGATVVEVLRRTDLDKMHADLPMGDQTMRLVCNVDQAGLKHLSRDP